MKSFIYLDTDTVNSYIAQIDNGLKTLQTQTSQSSSSTEKQSSHTTTAEGEADFSILGKGFDAKLDYIYNHIKNKTIQIYIAMLKPKYYTTMPFIKL